MSDKKDLLNLLIEKNPQKASDLASQLSVTPRTIYRWVDKLIEDGVPVATITGRSGGISLNEDYSSDSMQKTALSVKTAVKEIYSSDWIEVEFSDEEIQGGIDKKFVICQESIFTHHVLNFTYHLPNNKILICSTEPVKFFLHEKEWHLLAWIRQVEKFKVFKLINMTELQIGPEKQERKADFLIQEMIKK